MSPAMDGDFCLQSKPGVGYVLLKGYIFFKVGEGGKKGTKQTNK